MQLKMLLGEDLRKFSRKMWRDCTKHNCCVWILRIKTVDRRNGWILMIDCTDGRSTFKLQMHLVCVKYDQKACLYIMSSFPLQKNGSCFSEAN